MKAKQHPDKTCIGRAESGFDFLGYRIAPNGIQAARSTVERAFARVVRLYEQGASLIRIGQYARRWIRWLCAILHDFRRLAIRWHDLKGRLFCRLRTVQEWRRWIRDGC